MKNNRVKNILFALGMVVGTGIYQLVTAPEAAFDFYKPIFIGVFTLAIESIYCAIKPIKNC